MNKSVTIVIPVFNEQDSISTVVKNLKSHLPDISIIIVNDGSTDLTAKNIVGLDATIINHSKCYGYGTALRSGIEASETDFILFCDGDGQHQTKDVVRIIENAGDFDMVVGTRDRNSHSQLNRVPGKAILKWFADTLLGEKIPDLNSGLRMVRKSIIIKYLHLMPQGFSFSTTSTFAFIKDNRSVKWIPIKAIQRTGISSVKQLTDGPSVLLLLLRLSILFEPLKIFLFATFILFFLTVLSLLVNICFQEEFNITDTSVILGLGTLIVFLSGLLCDQVSAIRRNI